ncbi:MAG TPA: type III PLP-dependent enzyme [Candidatus Saccharimonadia bacterium]|nr:type III PLP-dependent enzyme [Candidatus Saccharimonadia bacterium]
MSTVQPVLEQPKRLNRNRLDSILNVPNRQTPFIVTNLSVVEAKATTFQKLLPKVGIYYAIKANNDPGIIKTLDRYVEGYDVASLGEVKHLISLGVPASKIVYSNPVKIPEHIVGAYGVGVRYFAFDSLAEIEKLAKYAPGSKVYLRLKVSDYGSKFPLSRKFGVDATYALDYCSIASDYGLQVVGVTFHVGSQSENSQVWSEAIKTAGDVIQQLREKGINIELLNLGGGFPADYGDPVPGLGQAARVIKAALRAHIPKDICVIAEPGRYMVANAGSVVTTVIGRENRSGVDWLYLDMGTFQGLIEPLEMPNLRYPIVTDKNPRCRKSTFVLSGPSCDAYDTLGADYILPADLKVGDRLYICATGAYSQVYASSFNGFEPPKVYHVK